MRELGFVLFLALLAAPALGQPGEDEVARAKRIFEEAQVHYRLQEYEAALTAYKEAYRILQSPSILFNLGQCYRLLGRYPEALRSYEQFLAAVPETPYRAEVEGLIAEVREKAPPATEPATTPALSPPDPAPGPTEASPARRLLPGGLALGGAAFG
jgi:tetratricopeptide (TPR) repeat protein